MPIKRLSLAVAAACVALSAGAAQAERATAPATASVMAARYGVFEEPLLVDGPVSAAQQAALERAVAQYKLADERADVSALAGWLQQDPQTPYKLSVLTNMGMAQLASGRYSAAIAALTAAMAEPEPTSMALRAQRDRALAVLIDLHARLGHGSEAHRLLAQTANLSGNSNELLANARYALGIQDKYPQAASLCGVLALRQLLQAEHVAAAQISKLDALQGEPGGLSLTALRDAAQGSGLATRVIQRAPDAAVPVPAVVHWKAGHYGAIIEARDQRYLVRDPVMQRDVWVSMATLNAESSGYFLVPAASQGAWSQVADAQARLVRGAGATNSFDPIGPAPGDPHTCPCNKPDSKKPPPDPLNHGMPTYSVDLVYASLSLSDLPVSYTPPVGPVPPLTLTYNQREANQPATFTYFNVGPKWTLDLLSFVQDDPLSEGTNVSIYGSGGGLRPYAGYSAGTFTPDERSAAVLVKTAASPARYELRMPDGSKKVYSQVDGQTSFPRRIFMSSMVDAQGKTLTFGYDSQLRLTSLTDALGQQTTLSYSNAAFPLQVTGLRDPFGRTAVIEYDAAGHLSALTDAMSMRTSFAWDTNTVITSMTTPYGTTTFAYGQDSGVERWVNVTDPLNATERVEFLHQVPTVPYSLPASEIPPGVIGLFNEYMNYRNSFYWDKAAYAVAGPDSNKDYNKAQLTHFLHTHNDYVLSSEIESYQKTTESRVWYNFPNQIRLDKLFSAVIGTLNTPTVTTRLLADGSEAISRASFNAIGKPLSITDEDGLETDYTYDTNQIDLLTVTAGGVRTATYTYNTQHRPLTYTDALGHVTKYTWNVSGQQLTETDARNGVTTYGYDAKGYLNTVTDARGTVTDTRTYDAAGRLATQKDALGHLTRYTYDALDRILTTTYPDGGVVTNTWNKLDLASVKDQAGHVTTYTFDAARNLTRVTDPLNHATTYSYDPSGRIATRTGSGNQTLGYKYDLDGKLISAIGGNTAILYGYDTRGLLTSVTGLPTGNVTYQYDHAKLLVSATLANNVSLTYGYDARHRLTSVTDSHGNSVVYTLDASGNRTREDSNDPGGQLASSLQQASAGQATGTQQ